MFDFLKRAYFEKQVNDFREFMRMKCINDYIKTFGNVDGMRKPSMCLVDENKIIASIDIEDNGDITLRFSKDIIRDYNHDFSVTYSNSSTMVYFLDENFNLKVIEYDVENEQRIFKGYMKVFKILFDTYNTEDSTTNRDNLNKSNISHSSNTVKSNCEKENIKRKILKMSSEMPYRTIVIKDIKKGTTVGIDTRLNKIDFEKCKKTGKIVLIITSSGSVNKRKIEIYLDNIVKVSNYDSKLIIEIYEKKDSTNNKNIVDTENIVGTENNTKPSINNRYNLYKPGTSNNINTNGAKNDTKLSIDNKHNRLTKEDEQEIKKDLCNLYSCKIIIIKDRKKDTKINLDKRLIEANYVRDDKTGKMVLTITSSGSVNKRKFEIYFENIIKLTKHNFRFTIDASEVMVYKL